MKYSDQSNIYSAIFSELVCIVCKYPQKIYIDEQNRLHNKNGTAVVWGNNKDNINVNNSDLLSMNCYYWHGISVDKNWVLKPELITKDIILSETNAEKRRCLREIIGAEKYFELLGGVNIIDTDKDDCNNEMILYESKENDSIINNKIQYLSVVDPSTGRKYILYPPNQKSKNVWEAKASTFNNESIMIRHGDVGLINLEKAFNRPIYES
jgi:hypothetical protein